MIILVRKTRTSSKDYHYYDSGRQLKAVRTVLVSHIRELLLMSQRQELSALCIFRWGLVLLFPFRPTYLTMRIII